MTEPAEPDRPARNLVLCLDGTWNGTYARKKRTRDHYVIKPSNVLKLARAVLPHDPASGGEQVVYYDMGVGSLAEYPGFANRLLRLSDRLLGGARGAGFEGNVEDALGFLALNHQPGDRVFVFGFSRGAATAQAITRYLDWAGGVTAKADAYYLPTLFRAYVESRGTRSCEAVVASLTAERARTGRPAREMQPMQRVDVRLLGVWDTVIAMGSRAAVPGRAGARGFHVGRLPPAVVARACQALAIDEVRFEFRPEVWEDHHDGQELRQRWFAGVHSNVGGGYVDDGLANLAFQWIRKQAEELGLAIDERFAGRYRGYALDRLYRSDTPFYRLWDALPGRRGRGIRNLIDRPRRANLTLDPSVIWRMQADPEATKPNDPAQRLHPDLQRQYRPENVMRYLAEQSDLDAYLGSLGVTDPLPDTAAKQIAKLRT